MPKVTIFSKKERCTVTDDTQELILCDPSFQLRWYRKEIGAKICGARLGSLDALENLFDRGQRIHQAYEALATNRARSIFPFGLRGICSNQWNAIGSMYFGNLRDNLSRMKAGVSSLSHS